MLAPEATTHVHKHAGQVQLNVGIDTELDRRLRAYCRATRHHLNFVVAAALRRHLARLGKAHETLAQRAEGVNSA